MPSSSPQKANLKTYTPVKRPDPISPDSTHDHELCLAKQKSWVQSLDQSERLREEVITEYNQTAEAHHTKATELEKQARELEKTRQRLQEVEAELEDASGKLTTAEEEIAEGIHAYEDQEKLLEVLRKDMDELEEHKEEVEGNLALAEAKVVEKTGAIAKLEEEIAKLSKKLGEAEVDTRKTKRVQENIQVTNDAIEIDNHKLKEELDAVKSQNKQLTTQLQQAKEALEKQGGCACVVM